MSSESWFFGALVGIAILLAQVQTTLSRIAAALEAIEERSRPRRCRVCGCTDEFGCPEGCWWVEEDLCSSCAEPQLRVSAYDDGEMVPR